MYEGSGPLLLVFAPDDGEDDLPPLPPLPSAVTAAPSLADLVSSASKQGNAMAGFDAAREEDLCAGIE